MRRSRIKQLRGLEQPQYRLRIGEVRVFYDVAGDRVEVLAVVSKAQADAWLQQEGRANEEGGDLPACSSDSRPRRIGSSSSGAWRIQEGHMAGKCLPPVHPGEVLLLDFLSRRA